MLKGLFIVGTNQYGVGTNFIRDIVADADTIHVHAELLDLANQASIQHHLHAKTDPDNFDFIFSFNGVGLEFNLEGKSLAKFAAEKPFFVFLVDHPLHLLQRFFGLPVILLCVSEEHVSFARLCGFKAFLFQHAVSSKLCASADGFLDYERKTGIVFPASYIDSKQLQQQLQPVWGSIGHLVTQSSSVTDFMGLLGVIPHNGQAVRVQLNQDVLAISRLVDFYLRGQARERLLARFQQAQIPITVVGRDALKYQTSFALHEYKETVSFTDLLAQIRSAKFVAHHSPGFQQGLHERVVYPMALGTLVIAQEPLGSILGAEYYDVDIANHLLIDQAHYQQLQAQNFRLVQQHTWQLQLKDILSAVGLSQ